MKLHYILAALLACVCAVPANANDLSDFGLTGVEACSDAEAATVRGRYFDWHGILSDHDF